MERLSIKRTTHPSQKASEAKVVDGKVYFTIDKPAQIVIDINGQMDDQKTGGDYSGPADSLNSSLC